VFVVETVAIETVKALPYEEEMFEVTDVLASLYTCNDPRILVHITSTK
jgi:hypothetical protein